MFVIDASVVSSWAFLDEETEISANVRRRMLAGEMALTPGVFPFEVANVILLAERNGRIRSEDSEQFLVGLSKLKISVEVTESGRLYHPIRNLAARFRLSIYDASYLELAMRNSLPLATFDKRLGDAAQSLGLAPLLP